MKKFIIAITILATLFVIAVTIPFKSLTVSASGDLDQILLYEIIVTTNDDATLDLTYHIEWKVLDSSTEGPMNWVEIGVPNMYIDNITYLGSNCDDIYYSSDGGAYIVIDFDRNYYRGDVAMIDFSFHQSRIFTMLDDQVTFEFKPGWFSSILVDKLLVKWDSTDAVFSNCDREEDGWLVWENNLFYNETRAIDVSYPKEVFPNRNENEQYSDEYFSVWEIIIPLAIIVGVILGIIILSGMANYYSSGGYYAYRGYYGLGYFHNFWYNPWFFSSHGVNRSGKSITTTPNLRSGSGGHSVGGSGSSCACACACACAGGGRAGCSRKDFTHNSNIIDIEKALER